MGTAAPFSRVYAEALGALGFGALYAAGGSNEPIEMGAFEDNPLTTDRERYLRNRTVLEAVPALGLGSPTVGWLRAAFRSIARLTAPDYPLKIQVPLLLFAAGMDTHRLDDCDRGVRAAAEGRHARAAAASSSRDPAGNGRKCGKISGQRFDAYMGVDEPVG